MSDPRLLCDAMLAHLARWLRAAGYDAEAVPPHTDDAAILDRARRESRIVLTCDRRMAARDVRVLHLPMTGIDGLAAALSRRLGIDWLRAPFSRCLVDNAPLRPATAAEIGQLPAPTRDMAGPFNACPVCGRVYWPGSHVRRMEERLRRFQRLAGEAPGRVGPANVPGAPTQGGRSPGA